MPNTQKHISEEKKKKRMRTNCKVLDIAVFSNINKKE